MSHCVSARPSGIGFVNSVVTTSIGLLVVSCLKAFMVLLTIGDVAGLVCGTFDGLVSGKFREYFLISISNS